MAKQVIWSKKAFDDRKEILSYWLERNQSAVYPLRLNQMFENAVELISKFPKIGKKTNYSAIRVKIVKDYFLTYRETPKTIEILTIWDQRKDPDAFQQIVKK